MSVTDRSETPLEERGAILPMMAILMVVLMGAAAMAVDLGWLFFNSIEIQHGADAAALGGVVYEPDYPLAAHTQARAAAKENGYDDVDGDTTVTVVDFLDDSSAVLNESMLRVTITHSVPTFFLTLFGIDSLDISRTAVAEFVQPLALGSPDNRFGNDPAAGFDIGLWASVHGTFGPQGWGDRYAALCLGNTAFDPGCVRSAEGRPSVAPGETFATGGYLYGIEVGTGASGLSVEVFDGAYYHYQDEVGSGSSTQYWTGDYGDPAEWGNPMVTTWFMLYGPDATPLDTTDGNELLCVVRYDARETRGDDFIWWDPAWTAFEDIDPSNLAQMWDSMASSADRTFCFGGLDRGPGIYPLRVMVQHDDGWWATNKYSLRASTTSGPSPDVYGLGDMSIFANVEGGGATSSFYLANVEERYAGKTLVVELWDPGDVDDGGTDDTLTISSGTGTALSCTWAATGGNSGTSCSVDVTAKVYNNQLITITIPIPKDYTCIGDACWFRATYIYTGADVHDTTTWTAYIDGAPVRIVE